MEITNIGIYTRLIENLHQKYGLHPLQNGCEIRAGKTWGAKSQN